MTRCLAGYARAILLLGLWLSTAGAPSLWAANAQELLRDAVKLYEKGQYEEARSLFEEVLTRDPRNNEAREYLLRAAERVAPPAAGRREPRVLAPGVEGSPLGGPEPGVQNRNDDDVFRFDAGAPVDSSNLLRQQNNLKTSYERRSLSIEKSIEVKRARGRTEVTLYMNRLFLPFTDVFTPEAYRVLRLAAETLRRDPEVIFHFAAVDNLSPAVRHASGDLIPRRTAVVFSYLLDLAHTPDKAAAR
jgi:tetratricopeptide (TPR) repeat protein